MEGGQTIGPESGPASGISGGVNQQLQAALLRMSPEQLSNMFEPFQNEMDTLNQGTAQQPHTTAGGAIMAGIGNLVAGIDKKHALERMQADAAARMNALGYGHDSQGFGGLNPVLAGGFHGASPGAQDMDASNSYSIPDLLRRPQANDSAAPDYLSNYASGMSY